MSYSSTSLKNGIYLYILKEYMHSAMEPILRICCVESQWIEHCAKLNYNAKKMQNRRYNQIQCLYLPNTKCL